MLLDVKIFNLDALGCNNIKIENFKTEDAPELKIFNLEVLGSKNIQIEDFMIQGHAPGS